MVSEFVATKIKRVFQFAFISACISFASCSTNKWYGTFEGIARESSQLNRLQSNGETKFYTGGRSLNGANVSVMRESSVVFVSIYNCRLRMTLNDATHASVSDGQQTCQININGYEGKVNVNGQARFEGDGKLIIQLKGKSTETNTNGDYDYNFQGERR